MFLFFFSVDKLIAHTWVSCNSISSTKFMRQVGRYLESKCVSDNLWWLEGAPFATPCHHRCAVRIRKQWQQDIVHSEILPSGYFFFRTLCFQGNLVAYFASVEHLADKQLVDRNFAVPSIVVRRFEDSYYAHRPFVNNANIHYTSFNLADIQIFILPIQLIEKNC